MLIKEFKIQYALGTLRLLELVKVAKNPNTFKSILKMVSKDKNWTIRHNVASNPNTSPDVLEKLCKDKYKEVRIEAERMLKYHNNWRKFCNEH